MQNPFWVKPQSTNFTIASYSSCCVLNFWVLSFSVSFPFLYNKKDYPKLYMMTLTWYITISHNLGNYSPFLCKVIKIEERKNRKINIPIFTTLVFLLYFLTLFFWTGYICIFCNKTGYICYFIIFTTLIFLHKKWVSSMPKSHDHTKLANK